MSGIQLLAMTHNKYRKELTTNHLEALVDRFDYLMPFDEVSCNPNITFAYVLKSVKSGNGHYWRWSLLSATLDITFADVLAHPELPWSHAGLSSNQGITLTDVLGHPGLPWDYYSLSSNTTLTIDIVLRLLDKGWNWSALSANPAIKIADILAHTHLWWNMAEVSKNPTLAFADVLANLKLSWDWESLSAHPAITLADVLAHPDFAWSRTGLIRNPSISFDQIVDSILKHYQQSGQSWSIWAPNYSPKGNNFDWGWLSSHTGLKISVVKMYPYGGWDWRAISRNPAIGVSDITDNPELVGKWSLGDIMANPNFSAADLPSKSGVKFDPHNSLSWRVISANPNVKAADVLGAPLKEWDFAALAKNKFNKHPIVRARLERLAEEADAIIGHLPLPEVLAAIVVDYVA